MSSYLGSYLCSSSLRPEQFMVSLILDFLDKETTMA